MDNPFFSEEFRPLRELEHSDAQLEDAIRSGITTEENLAAFQDGQAELRERLLETAESEELQAFAANVGVTAIRAYGEAELLKGILPDERVDGLLSDYSKTAGDLRRYFGIYGVQSQAAENFLSLHQQLFGTIVETPTSLSKKTAKDTPVRAESAELAQPEVDQTGEIEKMPLTITVGQGIVRIGKSQQGKAFQLSGLGPNDSRHNYSQERLAVLLALAKESDRVFSAKELKEMAGDPDMENNDFARIRSWFMKLHYGKNSIISTPKHGYYTFSEKYSPTVVENIPSSSRERLGRKISKEDIYVAVNHLKQFNPILPISFGLEISEELIKSVEDSAPDYSHIVGNAQAIWAARAEAMERITTILQDYEGLFKFLSELREESPEYKFIDSLTGLDEDQINLLKRFMHAHVEIDNRPDGLIEFWVIDSLSRTKDPIDHITINPRTHSDPDRTLPAPEDGDIVDSGNEAATEVNPVEETPAEPAGPEGKPEDVEPTPAPEPETATTKKQVKKLEAFNPGELEKLELVRRVVDEVALTFVDNLNPELEYTRVQIDGVFKNSNSTIGFSKKNVRDAKESGKGIIPKKGKHPLFTIEQVIRVILYNHNKTQNIFKTRKYADAIEKIIDQAIAKAIKDRETAV